MEPSRSSLKDAAKTAARDEAARMGVCVSDYVIGRLIEAAAPVLNGCQCSPPGELPIIDVESWED